jgi:hypothetical protein
MAETDQEDRPMTRDGHDEAGELAAFFAAARTDAAPPPTGLLDAVLADAAEVAAARARPARPRRRRWSGAGGFLAPIGGWGAAAALGACVALGFGAGLLGGGDAGAAALWDAGAPADPVEAFFDLAAAEG